MSGPGPTETPGKAESSNLPILTRFLEPQEAPDFRGYARILQKRFPTVLIVFSILFSIALIATLKQKPVYRAQVLMEIQKENPDIPPFRNSTNWTASPTLICDRSTPSWPAKAWRAV